MKRKILILSLAALSPAAFAQFVSNGLAVSVLGDGTATLGSSAAQTSIRGFDKTTTGQTGNFVVAFNNGGTGVRLTNSGSATSEGALLNSVDGQSITIGGYDAAAGTTGVVGSSAQRVVGKVDFGGNVAYTTFNDAYLANNIRSAITTDGSNYWMTGTASTSGGVRHGTTGPASTQVASVPTNTRVVGIYNGDLYFTSQTTSGGTFTGLSKISGLPTSSGNTATLMINTGSSASAYGFYFADANTVYIADDRASASGGIQKWSFDGSAWSLAYTLGTGVTNIGARGLAGETIGGVTTLYAITAESAANRLISLTDTGVGSAATTLSTAGANTVYRGVALTPVPEPGTMLALGAGLAAFAARRRRKA
jgi:hypothetical protein